MGCTSSAPNNVAPTQRANATDTEIEEEFQVEESKQVETVATIELPKCDTVKNQVDVAMVASNNESSMNIESPLLDPKDCHKDEPEQKVEIELEKHHDEAKETEKHNEAKDNLSANADEKITNMEDVVEKVVELYIADSAPSNALNIEETTEASAVSHTADSNTDTADQTTNVGMEQETEDEEFPSVVSPSQSQSSRATRWEALADIAAELPPTLTVDPLTGQIYALSK